MSRKHFSWLLFLTFVVAGLVLMVPGKTSKESSIEQTVLLPGAAAQVNDIDWLRLTSGGKVTVTTLKREGSVWVVEEASAYRADWGRLKTLLTGLSQAEVVEAKTANPDYYPRLGVEDVSAPAAAGVMIEFSAGSGLPALIIGIVSAPPPASFTADRPFLFWIEHSSTREMLFLGQIADPS